MKTLLHWVVVLLVSVPATIWADPVMDLAVPHISCELTADKITYKYILMNSANDLFAQKPVLRGALWAESDEAMAGPLEGRLLYQNFTTKADKKFTSFTIDGDIVGLLGPAHLSGKILNQKDKQKVEFTYSGKDDGGNPFTEKQVADCVVQVVDSK